MALRLYNTLTRRVEDFTPIEPGRVRMYCCGPTVHDNIGIHNARTFVTFDVVRRYFEYRGYEVTFVQNITDIEDKILQRAQAAGADPIAWAKRYAEAYLEDITRAGVRAPNIAPRATDTLPEIRALIQRLIEADAAYTTTTGVYYRVEAFPEYGKLSRRTPDDVRAGARVEVDEEKDDPRDFALWKRAGDESVAWDSPWGPGRPGWHIECSAMAMKHLGQSIDIHAGGADLLFPHHENEIAQSEKATGQPFARYWMHGGLLRVNGRRMGRSEGNLVRLRDALDRYPAEAVRLYLLSAHYRKPLDHTATAIEEHVPAIRRLHQCLSNLAAAAQGAPAYPADADAEAVPEHGRQLVRRARQTLETFVQHMDDDFNVPGALGALFRLVGDANRFLAERPEPDEGDRRAAASAAGVLAELSDVLGLLAPDRKADSARLAAIVHAAVGLRSRARAVQKWALADRIRDDLAGHGVLLRDSRETTEWEIETQRSPDETARAVVNGLAAMRREARSRQDWALADALRDALADAGVVLRDTRSGTEWAWAEGAPAQERAHEEETA